MNERTEFIKDIYPMNNLSILCAKCKKNLIEIEVSHDFPIYLCDGLYKKERKNLADKKGRHNLCPECHNTYERKLLRRLYKFLFNEKLVLNNPDRRSLIIYQSKILNLSSFQKWPSYKIVEKVNEEFYNKLNNTH